MNTHIWLVWRRRSDQIGRTLIAPYWSQDEAERRKSVEIAHDTRFRGAPCYDIDYTVEAVEVLGSPLSALAQQADG